MIGWRAFGHSGDSKSAYLHGAEGWEAMIQWRCFGHSGGSRAASLHVAEGWEAMIWWSFGHSGGCISVRSYGHWLYNLEVLWPLRRLQIGLSTWGRRLGSNDPAEVLWPLRRVQIGLST